MKQIECNKCGKVFEVEDNAEWGHCPFCENDQVEVGKEERFEYVCNKIEYIDGYILEGKTANGFHLEYACNLLNQQDHEIQELKKKLENAIVPKFKIEQEVYFRNWDGQIRYGKITDISYLFSRKNLGFNCIEYEVEYGNGYDEVESDWFSETIVYATKEEAKAKEMINNG